MPRIGGLKGRSRVLEVLKAARQGRLEEIPTRNDTVEFLLLFRGRWKAVDRNRLRRRLREGFRCLLGAGKMTSPRNPMVMKADRRMLKQEWNLLLETIMTHVIN